MKEELQNQLSDILKSGKDGMLQAIDILKKQSPDLVKQIYKWEILKSGLVFTIFSSIALSILFKRIEIYSYIRELSDYFIGGEYLITTTVLMIPIMFIVYDGLTWIKIIIAPKLFLVEYIKKIIK